MTIVKKADFIIKNKQSVYPNITTDGLVLYYDAKGEENSHTNRENLDEEFKQILADKFTPQPEEEVEEISY